MTAGLGVGVLGGGAFGRGLARACARSVERLAAPPILWSRRKPEIEGVEIAEHLDQLADRELIFVAVPSRGFPAVLDDCAEWLDGRHLLVHVSRGLPVADPDDSGGLMTASQLIRERSSCRRIGALAGPITATALLRGQPWGGVVGSEFPEVVDAVRVALGGDDTRLYGTQDLLGVELASSLTGLLLVILGFAQGLGVTPAMTGVLASRGLAEIIRIGEAAGASRETFQGLAAVGDIVAAVGGDPRPEIVLGRALADREHRANDREAQIQAAAGSHVEGLEVALRVSEFAAARGVEAPIATVVTEVLLGRLSRHDAIGQLMKRRVDRE